MKIGNFMTLLYAAAEAVASGAVAAATPNIVPKAEPTSPKLDELKSKYKEAWKAMIAIEDPTSQEAIDAKMAVWKLDGEMQAEKQAIVKAENEAKIAEARNQRLALNTTMLDAHKALLTAPKNTAADKLAELQTAFDTAKEAVDNELLAKYAASSAGRKKADSNGTPDSAEKSANKERILELARAGKKHKEIQDETGIPRSTVWHTINNAKEGGETFPNV